MGIVAFILAMLLPLIGGKADSATVITIPPMPKHAPALPPMPFTAVESECLCDECCHTVAVREFEDEFTALFNSYTYKRSSNGRSMINGKFVAMPKGK